MPTNDERRRLAGNMRVFDVVSDACGRYWLNGTLFGMDVTTRSEEDLRYGMKRLASFIDPDNQDGTERSQSEPVEGWTSFSDKLPGPGAPVLCKSKTGTFYVGQPVTVNRESANAVWVPKGGEYRAPAAWRPIEAPTGSDRGLPCDRDALLGLAEDVDGAADDSGGFEPLAGMFRDIARRIREAVGA